VAGWKILAVSKTSNIKQKLRDITYTILGSGISAVFSSITMGFLTATVTYNHLALIIDASFVNTMLFIQSILLISVFNPPKKASISASGNTPKVSSELGSQGQSGSTRVTE